MLDSRRAGGVALAGTHPVRRLRTAARRWHGEARLRSADPAAGPRTGPRAGIWHFAIGGPPPLAVGLADWAQGCSIAQPKLRKDRAALSPWESCDITRAADEVYGLPARMHVAEFQHSFAVSVPLSETG